MEIGYPTAMHQKTADEITAFFAKFDDVRAVLLTCSCARGKASKDSCLDIAILLSTEIEKKSKAEIITSWDREQKENSIYKEFRAVGKYSHVDLEFIDGIFSEGYHGWTSGPDDFEVEIGNFVAYSKPLYKRDDYFDQLKSTWLPYYNDKLRAKRLKMVKEYCLNNLHHIPLYVERGLYFQSFKRLYQAMEEFLQALFISKRKYPIAYDKWIKEQLCDILQLPNLYEELVGIMECHKFESSEHSIKADKLEYLVSLYCKE